MPTQLHLIRHGEVEVTAHKLFGGCRLDHALSPEGERQAAVLATWLRRTPLHALYCSPMRRAQRTLAPIASGRNLSIQTEPDLRELDFGQWTGLRWDEVQEKFGVSAFDWLEQLDRDGYPDGETGPAVLQRVSAVLDRLLARHADENIAVVCHGGIIRVALAHLLKLPLPLTAHFEIDYASLTWVSVGERPGWRPRHEIQLLNFTPWRDLAEQPQLDDLPA